MIQAKELRIGNIVCDPSMAVHVPIKEITQNYVTVDMRGQDFDGIELAISYEDLLSIPLTPEILEKCGFEADMGGWSLEGNINQPSFKSDNNRFGLS